MEGAAAAFGAERHRQIGDVFLGGRLEACAFLGVGLERDGAYVVAEDLPERFGAAARTDIDDDQRILGKGALLDEPSRHRRVGDDMEIWHGRVLHQRAARGIRSAAHSAATFMASGLRHWWRRSACLRLAFSRWASLMWP